MDIQNFHMLQTGSSSIFQGDSLYHASLDVGYTAFLANPLHLTDS